ncbi:MAG: hypothetical protein GWN07_16190, partial [Actinobacteria bacterium]|nr:hypothetical protein [Actinomycetota bacterium]NIW28822.1 hypothetical protein [Actinomycetota bacterium]NIX21285.1 hypothetical protein [Actinomycetota bacterium]
MAERIDARTERLEDRLPGTEVEVRPVCSWPGWREAALYDAASGTLVAGDALAAQPAGTAPGERLAVAPYLRLVP